jgi:sulfatase modifying factor 1
MRTPHWTLCLMGLLLSGAHANPLTDSPTVRVHGLDWDVHEVTIGQVKAFAQATGFVSRAEKEGGGTVYEAGWATKKGWTWRQPYGVTAQDTEPAVHLTFDEAQAICRHAGKRLPTDAEWTAAAYLEQRQPAPPPFVTGQRYRYPDGDSARQSHCLQGCLDRTGVAPAGSLWRGSGHLPVNQLAAGVNGLRGMGGNVWEWVDTGEGEERITRGGSWWYDAARQVESDVATKPRMTRVVYIGFRCVRPAR